MVGAREGAERGIGRRPVAYTNLVSGRGDFLNSQLQT